MSELDEILSATDEPGSSPVPQPASDPDQASVPEPPFAAEAVLTEDAAPIANVVPVTELVPAVEVVPLADAASTTNPVPAEEAIPAQEDPASHKVRFLPALVPNVPATDEAEDAKGKAIFRTNASVTHGRNRVDKKNAASSAPRLAGNWRVGVTDGFNSALERAIELICSAKTLVVGAGAGLSLACGDDFHYEGDRFTDLFGDFEREYGFHDMYTGEFMHFPTAAEHWGFWCRVIMNARFNCPVGKPYRDLLDIVLAGGRGDELQDQKDYFVVTSNVDHQFQRAGFDKKHLFYMQGDYGLWQCSHGCRPVTYDNEERVRLICAEQSGRAIDPDLVPRCPQCGAEMKMNLHTDDRFVTDRGWHMARDRYAEFLRKHQRGKIVYLELGVGANTPGIIKEPFWKMAGLNSEATYIQVNLGQSYAPAALGERAVLLNGDAARALESIKYELYR